MRSTEEAVEQGTSCATFCGDGGGKGPGQGKLGATKQIPDSVPGRSAHQALQALRDGLMEMDGGYLIDLDIRSYFDSVDPKHAQDILRKRVRDGVVRRLIGKWLNAGVLEDGKLTYSEVGVPQGGVISPLISNIYLHEVLDTWFAETVLPRMRGRAFMIRYADDGAPRWRGKEAMMVT